MRDTSISSMRAAAAGRIQPGGALFTKQSCYLDRAMSLADGGANWNQSAGDFGSAMDDRKAAILAEIPRLRRYARALLRNRDAADDLVQDSLERALLRMDNWRTGENPRRWLFTIMHHLFVDQTRKTKRRAEVVMLTLEDSEAMSSPAEQTESVALREIIDALQAISP